MFGIILHFKHTYKFVLNIICLLLGSNMATARMFDVHQIKNHAEKSVFMPGTFWSCSLWGIWVRVNNKEGLYERFKRSGTFLTLVTWSFAFGQAHLSRDSFVIRLPSGGARIVVTDRIAVSLTTAWWFQSPRSSIMFDGWTAEALSSKWPETYFLNTLCK
jgi:hypothetical protein